VSRHRDGAARRRMSRGPVIAVVLVVAVVLAIFGWFGLRDRIDAQRVSAADSCVSGQSTLEVAANSSIAPALTELAERYTAKNTVIRDHCIRVVVRAASDQRVLAGLQGTWDNATLGAPPAAWVPLDSSSSAQLAAAKPAFVTDKIRSLATSPLLLAVPRAAAQAISAANLSWADLPKLQSAADGWSRFGQPNWGALTIATPTGRDGSTAAALTTQAVAAALSGTAPVTAEVLARPATISAIAALRLKPRPQPTNTASALSAMTGLSNIKDSPFQAVPATEQQIFDVSQDPGSTPLATVQLAGATPMADFPFVGIKAPWVDDTQGRAAAAFSEFLGQPDQQKVLAAAGFRSGDAPLPAATPAVSFAPVGTVLPAPDAAAAAAVDALLTKP
jgi:Tfp pilus assembly protein PilX